MPNIDLGKVSGEQGPPGPVAQGTMMSSTYDPNGKSQDVFAYTDDAKQEAKDYAAPAVHAAQHGASGSDPVTPKDIGAIPATEKGAAGGVASLGTDGKVPAGQIPAMDYAAKTHAAQHGASGSDPITPAAIGAVSKVGDTMTGNLILARSGYSAMSLRDTSVGSSGRFQHSNHATMLEARDTDTDDNRRYLTIYDQTKQGGVKDALRLADVSNGSYRFYTLLHEGNLSDISIAKIATGSYVGTGTYGPDNKNSLTFPFNPKFVAIWMDDATIGPLFVFTSEKSNYTLIRSSGGDGSRNCSFDGNTLSWWSGDGSYNSGDEVMQANSSGVPYNYVALG